MGGFLKFRFVGNYEFSLKTFSFYSSNLPFYRIKLSLLLAKTCPFVRWGRRLNPNRSLERLFIHSLSLISLSVRFHLPADILPVVLFSRSPLRLPQTAKLSARPSNETDSESNDRFGLNSASVTRIQWMSFGRDTPNKVSE